MTHTDQCTWGAGAPCRPSCPCACHWGHLPVATQRYLARAQARRAQARHPRS